MYIVKYLNNFFCERILRQQSRVVDKKYVLIYGRIFHNLEASTPVKGHLRASKSWFISGF